MNQRMGHRTGHAAVPFGQCVKRRNGVRVAQHHGDLPTFGAVGILSARLLRFHALTGQLCSVGTTNGICPLVRHLACRPAREWVAADADVERAIRLLGDGDRGANGELLVELALVHGLLRSGSIPPMSESYAVTSDMSTPYAEDFGVRMNDRFDDALMRYTVAFVAGLMLCIWMCGGYA